jgi:uncharacterized protein YutE (UPF0331/DUF86 family)
MTDRPLVEKRLAAIETCVGDLRRLARPALLDTDVREQRFIEHSLQVAIQAALDVASHIVSDRRLGEPQTNRELFTLLERGGWISSDLRARLAAMAGFRNVLVHGYDDVDIEVVRDVVTSRLGDLEEYVAAIRRMLAEDELEGDRG